MNTRELINKVLVGLRQDQIGSSQTTTTDAYELLLLQFVNEAKEEIEESWDWQALRSTVTVTLAASTVEYTLTSAGDADTDTTERTQLLYEKGATGSESTSHTFGSRPQCFDVTSAAERRLTRIAPEKMERMHLTDSDETNEPMYFSLTTDGTSLKMKVWPTPDDTYTIKLRLYIPQAELADSDLTTELTIPDRPVWTKALWKANEERGSELARPGGSNDRAATDALSAAIAREQTVTDRTSYPE